MSRRLYQIKRDEPDRGDNYSVWYRGMSIGSLDIHDSGYCDWTFWAGGDHIPSQTTQRRLVRAVQQEE